MAHQIGTGTAATGAIQYGLGTNDLFIGSRNGAGYFNGAIDEVGIYSRALGANDVARINQLGSVGKSSFFGNKTGVTLFSGANSTTIGTSGSGNTISGNIADGIDAASITGLTIAGNFVGTDTTGANAVANAGFGVSFTDVSSSTIGGLTATPGANAGNVISGNGVAGISLSASTTGTHDVTVQGNIIGLNAAGTSGLGGVVVRDGIDITGAYNVLIGGTTSTARNVISGNGNSGNGVLITGSGSHDDVVAGNYIGTDMTGSSIVTAGYQGQGVNLTAGAHDNTIGGTSSAAAQRD